MDERAASGPPPSHEDYRCNTCGSPIVPHSTPKSYHIVPAGQMDRAAAGGHVPWSIWLCAACYQREHP